jgi:hypothetical protein
MAYDHCDSKIPSRENLIYERATMTEDGFTCITIPIPGFLDPSLEGNLRLAPSPGISLLEGRLSHVQIPQLSDHL